jgi:hypothetical protein
LQPWDSRVQQKNDDRRNPRERATEEVKTARPTYSASSTTLGAVALVLGIQFAVGVVRGLGGNSTT